MKITKWLLVVYFMVLPLLAADTESKYQLSIKGMFCESCEKSVANIK